MTSTRSSWNKRCDTAFVTVQRKPLGLFSQVEHQIEDVAEPMRKRMRLVYGTLLKDRKQRKASVRDMTARQLSLHYGAGQPKLELDNISATQQRSAATKDVGRDFAAA